jgi:hypothetical protein
MRDADAGPMVAGCGPAKWCSYRPAISIASRLPSEVRNIAYQKSAAFAPKLRAGQPSGSSRAERSARTRPQRHGCLARLTPRYAEPSILDGARRFNLTAARVGDAPAAGLLTSLAIQRQMRQSLPRPHRNAGEGQRRTVQGSEGNRTCYSVAAAQSALSSPACCRQPKPAERPGWLHETKHDGFRFVALRDAGGVRLYTRSRSSGSTAPGTIWVS